MMPKDKLEQRYGLETLGESYRKEYDMVFKPLIDRVRAENPSFDDNVRRVEKMLLNK
jgi:hypothetical protein